MPLMLKRRPMASSRREISPPVPARVQSESGDALLHQLQKLYCCAELIAKSFCDISHHPSKAGAVGDVKRWGLAPQPSWNT
eukprot:4214950-Pyramimonas_sp.AAC.1